MNTIKLVEKDSCVGCGACQNICPVECIEMNYDSEGFLYPKIDDEKCISCGKCAKSCPVMSSKRKNDILSFWGGYIKDKKINSISSSGGAFWWLAEKTLCDNGMVYGATIDSSNGHVYHMRVDSIEELELITKSKYVQSEIGKTYKSIQSDLQDGHSVLFCGTPCQVAGLRSYLVNDDLQKKLVAVEFICHGCPSPMVWEEYIQHLREKGVNPIQSIDFRDKRNGWHNFGLSIKYGKNSEHNRFKGVREDVYYNGFIENLFLRPSCYSCRFKGLSSYADISIADFWNCENRGGTAKLNERQFDGISLIIAFSKKGRDYVKSCGEEFYLEEMNDEKCITTNVAQIKPAEKNKNRKKFFALRQRKGTVLALNKYAKYTFRKKITNIVKWKLWKLLGWYQ